jgi:hypothetical protein
MQNGDSENGNLIQIAGIPEAKPGSVEKNQGKPNPFESRKPSKKNKWKR